MLFAPRMWRCFSCACFWLWCWCCLLHACGDVSVAGLCNVVKGLFAPRMWRCFHARKVELIARKVCSTHVEMFPAYIRYLSAQEGLLHACGDVSGIKIFKDVSSGFAPRMWRCFHFRLSFSLRPFVCSTHVEMFLTSRFSQDVKSSLLHACGDVSVPRFVPLLTLLVCSTHVEMFPSRQVPPAPR